MIKQIFFQLLAGLLLCASSGCTSPNASGTNIPGDAEPPQPLLSKGTNGRRDALSAYARAHYGILQENTGTEIQLIGIQGQWVDQNLWGEWEYTFAADQKQWTYNDEGLRLTQAIKETSPMLTAVPPAIERLLSELSAQLDLRPPLLSAKRLAKVNWTPALGWVYNISIESNSQ